MIKISKEETKQDEQTQLLIEIKNTLKNLEGGWLVPTKPDQTVFNYGHYILSRTLKPNTWEPIAKLPAQYAPYIIYWKIIIANTPNIDCLCFQEGQPVCAEGCSLAALNALGVNLYNDRGWCHLYDEENDLYGIQCNIIRPIVGDYTFYVKSSDTVDRQLIVCYMKWYQWKSEHKVLVGEL